MEGITVTNNKIADAITQKLEEIKNENSIIVLKGIPIAIADPDNIENINIEEATKNKLSYFMKVVSSGRKILTYEEYILLNSFILEQYETVFVLRNNVYIEQYPIDANYSDDVKQGLIIHFRETDGDYEEDEEYVGNIGEIINLYDGITEVNGYLIGAYCEARIDSDNIKIEYVNIFNTSNYSLESVDEKDTFIDIIEESDYIEFVRTIFNEPDEIYVRIANYVGNQTILKEHIKILAENWSDWTDVYVLQPQKINEQYEHREEYSQILKKYWGYDSFRNLSVYNMAKLENGEKEVNEVSQENIISNLVQQVERCSDADGDFRDIFVTAPTGAGKSVMFQVPAIYLAEKYNLLTIVISPLIGLMNDQVKGLEVKNYTGAKTINSDISPIIKQDITEKVAEGTYHILYISPETLLSRSDVEQLIGDRTIGMIVIDEAHIVTTWGKQFRPDYWYLGDHIRKLRKKQLDRKGCSFVISTFTATAIYHGVEDMYTETINSLHMLNPITYLGYVKRDDINIVIDNSKKDKGTKTSYEPDKFAQIEELIKRAIITDKKALIYFPTVKLIERCYEDLRANRMVSKVARYHGQMNKDDKVENYEKFYNKEKLVMLATKAFGMGIDINDIEIVEHFAPTGNVCDYVQEIGRAARKEELKGEALYHYNTKDFKHINRLHGLSTIKKYQLIQVMEKIDELYTINLRKKGKNEYRKKRNAMLLDAENFAYIFGNPVSDEDDSISKVKTALLTIQKDFENKRGYSPIAVRPIPMFSIGFFQIDPKTQKKINDRYYGCVEQIDDEKAICRVFLNRIWEKSYKNNSFPQFKYLIYSRSEELDFVQKYLMYPALCVSIKYEEEHCAIFNSVWGALKAFIKKNIVKEKYISIDDMAVAIEKQCGIGKYKAKSICEVIIASMDSYRNSFSRGTATMIRTRPTNAGAVSYQFQVAVNSYFAWVENGYKKIVDATNNEGKLYLVNKDGVSTKEVAVVLGILEAMNVLAFEMIGGANSQLYIYINQIHTIKNIIKRPFDYNNRLLDMVSDRHTISVKMLTYLYENDFSNEQRWELIEEYFLGNIPEEVKKQCQGQITVSM